MPTMFHEVATRPRLGFIASILLLIGTGCQQDPRGWHYIRHRPLEKDLVGVYKLDSKNYQNGWYTRKGLQLPESTLTMNADGTWTGLSVPDCWTTMDCSGKVENLKGRWLIGTEHNNSSWWLLHVVAWQEGEPEYLNLPNVQPGMADTEITLMNNKLMNNKPPYILHFIVGDPDSGNGLSYTK